MDSPWTALRYCFRDTLISIRYVCSSAEVCPANLEMVFVIRPKKPKGCFGRTRPALHIETNPVDWYRRPYLRTYVIRGDDHTTLIRCLRRRAHASLRSCQPSTLRGRHVPPLEMMSPRGTRLAGYSAATPSNDQQRAHVLLITYRPSPIPKYLPPYGSQRRRIPGSGLLANNYPLLYSGGLSADRSHVVACALHIPLPVCHGRSLFREAP